MNESSNLISCPYNAVPEELRTVPQWITWSGNKVPTNSSGKKCDASPKQSWRTFSEVQHSPKIGFVFTGDDPYCGIDLDGCYDGQRFEPWAQEALDLFRGLAYAEISPSGNGAKLWVRAKKTCGQKILELGPHKGIECWDEKRFFAVTGKVIQGFEKVGPNCQLAFNRLVAKYKKSATSPTPETSPTPDFDAVEVSETKAMSIAILACEKIPAEWGEDGSGYLLRLCRQCVRAGVSARTAINVVRTVISTHEDYPTKWTDQEILARFEDAKTQSTPGEGVKLPIISNFTMDGKNKIGKTAGEIYEDFRLLKLDLVRSLGMLCHIDGDSIDEFKKTSQLFAAINGKTKVNWNNGFITKEEFFEHVKSNSPRCDRIELTPHIPPVQGIRYLRTVQPCDTSELEKLIDLLSPSTEFDRQLILAAIATMSWGGPPGKRPGFTVTCGADDGIGSGKSTTCELIASAAYLGDPRSHDVSEAKDFPKLVTHMLSPTGAGVRPIIIDNAKSRVSGQDIESLLTKGRIAGHAMWIGHQTIDNRFVWFVNGNELGLSDDLATRLIPIQIDRAKYSADWSDKVGSIDWQKVLGGVATVLNRSAKPIHRYTRWSIWEREVLSKCALDPNALIAHIKTRQSSFSETTRIREELKHAILDYVAEELDKDRLFIPSRDMQYIFRGVFLKEFSGRAVSDKLKKLKFLDGLVSKDSDTSERRYRVHLPDDFQAHTEKNQALQAHALDEIAEDELAFAVG